VVMERSGLDDIVKPWAQIHCSSKLISFRCGALFRCHYEPVEVSILFAVTDFSVLSPRLESGEMDSRSTSRLTTTI
jgi:hypothetical protein